MGDTAWLDAQATTPVWYVLHDPAWMTRDGPDDRLLVCGTTWEYRILRIPVKGACYDEADVEIIATCRSCGERPFTICGLEIDDLMAGIAHAEPWCVYCTEATARHEVTKITPSRAKPAPVCF